MKSHNCHGILFPKTQCQLKVKYLEDYSEKLYKNQSINFNQHCLHTLLEHVYVYFGVPDHVEPGICLGLFIFNANGQP